MPIVKDGEVIAGQPLPPPPALLAMATLTEHPTLLLLVDKLIADVQPLVQLAHAIVVHGRRLVVALMNWNFAPLFDSSQGGFQLICVPSAKEALEACKPSLVLYTYAMRSVALWHEHHYGAPAVMVGFKRAYLAIDHPPRPSFRIRGSSDAALAADVLDEFVSCYVETGIFREQRELEELNAI